MPTHNLCHNDRTFTRGSDEQTSFQLSSLANTEVTASTETELLSHTVGVDETLFIGDVHVTMTNGDSSFSMVLDWVLYIDGVPRGAGKIPSTGGSINVICMNNPVVHFSIPLRAWSGSVVELVVKNPTTDTLMQEFFSAIRGWNEKIVTVT